MLVGVSILREAGIIPFAVWFAANTAAIPFFGWLSRKVPGLWAQTRRLPMRMLMTIMLIFTMWINLTGMQTAGGNTGWFVGREVIYKIIPLVVLFLVWIATYNGGIRWSVVSDRVQWTLELGSVILILLVTVIQHGGFFIAPGLKWGSYTDLRGWILGLWTVPLLLSNPFLDGTFWHRAAYAKDMKPYWWGYGMFTAYLVCVALVGFMGLTAGGSAILFAVIFFASFSTLDSCTAALQLTSGKKLGNLLGFLSIFGWIPISALGLLDAWIAMFIWYPFLFGVQVLTLYLEKRGKLHPVSEEALAARDALPLLDHEQPITAP